MRQLWSTLRVSPAARSRMGWLGLRLLLALLIALHGWARWWAGGVVPFGSFLEQVGFPFGLAIATAITAMTRNAAATMSRAAAGLIVASR